MSDYSPHPSFSGAKLPLRPMHVWGIRVRLQVERRIRDLALFDLAIDSKLRGCDLVALRIADVGSWDASQTGCRASAKDRATRPIRDNRSG